MSNQQVLTQLMQFGYIRHEVLDAMNHVNNENDINQVMDYMSIMSSYGWQVAFTNDGKLFYKNHITKKTSWKNPLTATSSTDKLPNGWKKCIANDGRVYYQNNVTKKTQWHRPKLQDKNVRIALPKGWRQCVGANGSIYYQNEITKITQWEKPTRNRIKYNSNQNITNTMTDNGEYEENKQMNHNINDIKSWKNKKLRKWSNDDIVEWIKSIEIASKWRNILIHEIKNCECNGKDIMSLQCGEDIGLSFGISAEPHLCDEIYKKLEKLKDNQANDINHNKCNNAVKSWKNKKLKKWTNRDVTEWINNIGIPVKWRNIMMDEIKNCQCTGKDLMALQSSEDIGFSFGVSNAPKLCDEILLKIEKLKYNRYHNNNILNNENRFKINIFSHGKTFTLNQSVSANDKIYFIKKLYKNQSKVDANISDIHFYLRSKLLLENRTLQQVSIIDEKHLISVKFGADGAKSGATIIRCICSKILRKMEIYSCYNGGSVSCDECYEILDRIKDEYVYHCMNEINSAHSQGYDLCLKCAQKQ